MLHRLVTWGRGRETIRLDVRSSAFVSLDRGFIQHRPQGVLSTSVRVERLTRSPTAAVEETKIREERELELQCEAQAKEECSKSRNCCL